MGHEGRRRIAFRGLVVELQMLLASGSSGAPRHLWAATAFPSVSRSASLTSMNIKHMDEQIEGNLIPILQYMYISSRWIHVTVTRN